jgi:hypothetical protein
LLMTMTDDSWTCKFRLNPHVFVFERELPATCRVRDNEMKTNRAVSFQRLGDFLPSRRLATIRGIHTHPHASTYRHTQTDSKVIS